MPPTPIPVYITPTPSDTPTAAPTNVPTLDPIPTETAGSPLEPTRTPMVIGAIVGPNYTIPPTDTPRATRTPIETVPPRPSSTPIPPTGTIGPSPTPLPQLDAGRVGVQLFTNLGREEWDDSLNRSKELGVRWIKVQMNWAFLQPNGQNPSEEVLRTFELNLETADQAGFQILLSIVKAPQWTRSTQGDDAPPDNPQAFVDFLNMVFLETKIDDVADAIEIWNEPNLRREWNTNAYEFSGAGYMRLFEPAYRTIRSYRPDITIITAALAPTSNTGFSVDDRDFLRQMYAAGLGNFTDVAIGSHPYGWGNPPDARCCAPGGDLGWDDDPHFFFLNNLEDTRAIMDANGHNNAPIWITELGWATWQDIQTLGYGLPDPPENNLWMNYSSPIQQADYTIRALEILQQERTDIAGVILWNLNYANELTLQNRQEIIAYSLLIPGLPPRPLFYLLPLAFAPR
ncbi:MAG: hypothetical protein MUF87_03155 [Anaerolineae bacterium]|nr:hypothetical protein [Anaerolineae bacterium]